MAGSSCLYRRPSGIYVVRLVVPARLRSIMGRGEIHVSTGLRELNAAKLAALKIEFNLRERFMTLDVERLVTASPLLHGEGILPIVGAAKLIGLSVDALLSELLQERADVWTLAQNWGCWHVADFLTLETEPDGGFVLNEVEEVGDMQTLSGMVRAFYPVSILGSLIGGGKASDCVFRGSGRNVYFTHEMVEVPLPAWMAPKCDVERVRSRLAAAVTPDQLEASKRASEPAVVASAVALDPINARHGKVRFSELFELMLAAKSNQWVEDTRRRMKTEAAIFTELMNDPELGSIESETIIEYASKLASLPSRIDQVKRKYKVETLAEVIEITCQKKLECKKETTIKGHVGRLSEIFGWARADNVRKMSFNPAVNFGGGKDRKAKPQKNRDAFTPEDLTQIFSAEWFRTGAGKFEKKGSTQWRPHYYWLPLIGLFVGGRINELSQLYLKDVIKGETGVWYFDFNLDDRDKVKDIEGKEVGPDGSLKTVNSERVVPVHDRLIQLGLIDYVEALKLAGERRLFPELKHDAVKGYGKPAGSWFNARYLGQGLKIKRNGRKTFHSFRHTCLTALDRLENPAVGERVIAELAGHIRGETTSGTVYIKDRAAEMLKPTIDRLDFPSVAEVARFNITDGLKAIKWAKTLKSKKTKTQPVTQGA